MKSIRSISIDENLEMRHSGALSPVISQEVIATMGNIDEEGRGAPDKRTLFNQKKSSTKS